MLALTPTTMLIADGSLTSRPSKASCLLAYTGQGKSPLLKFAYATQSSEVIKEAFEASSDAAIKKCRYLNNHVTTSINLNELLKSAEKWNEPAGMRIVVEELSQLCNQRFEGKPQKCKMESVDMIQIVDPSFESGKKTGSNKISVDALRVVITAGCQPNKIHQFLPHTLEGESFRVDIIGTPVLVSTEN